MLKSKFVNYKESKTKMVGDILFQLLGSQPNECMTLGTSQWKLICETYQTPDDSIELVEATNIIPSTLDKLLTHCGRSFVPIPHLPDFAGYIFVKVKDGY